MGTICLTDRMQDNTKSSRKNKKDRAMNNPSHIQKHCNLKQNSLITSFANPQQIIDKKEQVQRTKSIFTYFMLTQQVEDLIKNHMQKIWNNSINLQPQNNVKKAYQDQNIEQKRSFSNQTNEKQYIKINEQELNKIIKKGNQYIQQLNQLIKSQFMVKIQKLQRIKLGSSNLQSSNQKLSQEQDLIWLIKQKQAQKQPLLANIKQDVFNIFVAKYYPNIQNIRANDIIKQHNKNSPYFISTNRKKLNPQNLSNSKIFQKELYLLKIQMSQLATLFQNNNDPIKRSDRKQSSKNNIQRLQIAVFDQMQQKQKDVYVIEGESLKNILSKQLMNEKNINRQINNTKKSHNKKQGLSQFLQIIVKSSTLIRFKTYPYQSTFTLLTNQILKFPLICQHIKFIKTISTISNKNTSSEKNNQKLNSVRKNRLKKQQISYQTQQYAQIKLKIQFFSSNFRSSIQNLKMRAKNTLRQIQQIKKGQNFMHNVYQLKSSYETVSQIQSSFISRYQQNNGCC